MLNQSSARMDYGSEIKQFVMQLWCEVLNTAGVTDADNFFKLGGHSLTALHVIDVVEQSFQVELGGMREMCENPTLGEFVSLVVGRQGKLPAVGDG